MLPRHKKCCCCWLSPVEDRILLVSVMLVLQLAFVLMLNVSPSRSITQPEAFCAGTTAAYRKGNGSNSALAPSITLRPPITPAPVDHPCTRFGA